MDIGKRIKALRVENSMTQKQLAEKLGLTPKMISFYEQGERIPPLDIVEKLVNIFSQSSDYIIGITSAQKNSTTDSEVASMPSITTLTVREQDLIKVFRQLSVDNQDIIVGDAKKYLKEQVQETKRLKNAN